MLWSALKHKLILIISTESYGRVNNEYLCAECPVEESDKIKLRIIKNIVERLEKMV